MQFAFLTVVAQLIGTPVGAGATAQVPAFDAREWRADVRVIARALPETHPNAFYRMSRAEWDSAVNATEQRITTMNRSQALVALMELVATVRDGHTTINPIFDAAANIRYYPFELYQFEDGLFVRSAAPQYAAIAGAKVLRVGRLSAQDALAAVARVIAHENDWWVKRWAPRWLSFVEVLDGLGIVADMEQLPLVIERNGREETWTIAPAGRLSPKGHNPNAVIDQTDWTDMRGAGEPPLWLRDRDRVYWSSYDSAANLIYVAYRANVNAQPSNVEFWRSVFAKADSFPTARLILDIRENTGGESFYNRQVVRGIVARPHLDKADKLFVIVGGRTFSAAMNLTRDLERWTNATFVGEPTGNAAYFFGDHTRVRLPGSGLTLLVSTLTWPPYDPRDRRDFFAPFIYTPLMSADYRSNVDPALRAIIERSPHQLTSRVEAAVKAGDTAGAARIIVAAAQEEANRFRSPEPDINALGYRLLRANSTAAAIAVFRSNTRAFPRSANAWDSLGEALAAAGQRAEAIEAYRQALRIQPGFAPAVTALHRLEAEGQP